MDLNQIIRYCKAVLLQDSCTCGAVTFPVYLYICRSLTDLVAVFSQVFYTLSYSCLFHHYILVIVSTFDSC